MMVDAREQPGLAADVLPLLAHLEAGAAHHQVDRLREVDLGVALDERLQRHRGEVVGTNVLERALGGTADGRADGVDDDGFRMELRSSGSRAIDSSVNSIPRGFVSAAVAEWTPPG